MVRSPSGRGLIRYGLLVVLVVCGVLGGLYLSGIQSGGSPAGPTEPTRPSTPNTPSPAGPHTFALSALDVKDTQEAPALAVGPGGAVYLTWASKTGEAERTVFFTRSRDAGHTFEAPRALSKAGVYKSGRGSQGGFERRATPHVAVLGDHVDLTWSEALPDRSAMRLVLASSADAGLTFGPPAAVHSGTKANPTFTALAGDGRGGLVCAWLDDRTGAQSVFATIRRGGSPVFDPDGVIHTGQEGKGVCPCCPTAACFAPDGTVYIAFRDAKDGFRDIALCRLRPGQKVEGPFPVVADTWKFNGCPHDGPSLAVVGDTLHVVWMDARSGRQRCYYAHAGLSDLKFEAQELNPAAAGTQGNARLFADAQGTLVAVWEESQGSEPPAGDTPSGHQHGAPKVGAGGGRAVMVGFLPPGEKKFEGVRAVLPKEGAFQTRPALIGNPEGELFVAWNELDTAGKAVVVTAIGRTGGK